MKIPFISKAIESEVEKRVLEIEEKFNLMDERGLTEIQKAIIFDMMGSRDIHKKLWIANFCARLVSQNVARLPVQLKEGGKVIEQDDKYDIFNAPNPLYSGFEFKEFCCLQLIYKGNIYIHVVGRTKYPKESPQELWPLFSANINPEIIGGKNAVIEMDVRANSPANLIYKDISGGRKKPYMSWEIIHVKEPSDDSHIEGVSWIAAAGKNIEHINKIERYKNKLYERGQFLSFNLHSPDWWDDGQLKAFRKNYMETYAGEKGIGLPLITYGGMEAKPLSWSPADMDLLASEKLTVGTVATIMGVPAEMLGPWMDKKNVATYREALKQFMMITVIPTADRIFQKFSRELWPDSDRHIEINENAIGILRPPAEEVAKMTCASINEKRSIQGLSKHEGELYDTPMVSQSVQLATELLIKEDKEEM